MNDHKSPFQTELNKLKGVKLSDAQKKEMRQRIYTVTPIPSPFMALLHSRVVVAFAAFFMVLGSVSYVSANSMPGDLFYGVKARVLDPLAQVFVREKKDGAPASETFQTLSLPTDTQDRVSETVRIKSGENANSSSEVRIQAPIADVEVHVPAIEVEIATSTVSATVETPVVDADVTISPEETSVQVETPVGETGLTAPALPVPSLPEVTNPALPVAPPSTPDLGL